MAAVLVVSMLMPAWSARDLEDQLAWLTKRSYATNIPKFFVFRFVWEFMLFFPIWVIFLQEARGFSLTRSL